MVRLECSQGMRVNHDLSSGRMFHSHCDKRSFFSGTKTNEHYNQWRWLATNVMGLDNPGKI